MLKPIPITIRELSTLAEAEECEDLQLKIWPPHQGTVGFCIPIHLLVSQRDIGGVVLGAYVEERIIGFIYAVPAHDRAGRPYHYSCLAGVHPEFQHGGVMERLKWRHADIALAQNIKQIRWTYDPLQGANANLNIKKLGGIVKDYKINYYGIRAGGSPQNYGMPSDRFVVEWNISGHGISAPHIPASLRHVDLLNSHECSLANTVLLDETGLPFIKDFVLDLSSRQVLVEIPDNFARIRRHTSKGNLDIEWRLKTREIFTNYLKLGYTVIGFFSENEDDRRRSFYLLEK
jgi:predicted GNAT superfamily acetyltransferase